MIKVLTYEKLPVAVLDTSALFDRPGPRNSWSVVKLRLDNLSPPQISANRAEVGGVRPVGGEGLAGAGRTAAVHLAASDESVVLEVLDDGNSITAHRT